MSINMFKSQTQLGFPYYLPDALRKGGQDNHPPAFAARLGTVFGRVSCQDVA